MGPNLPLSADDVELTLLPLERAREHLRPLASEADVRHVRKELRADRERNLGPWLSRRQAALDKLSSADPVKLAQIVSEGAVRQRMRLGSGSKPQLSAGEREIFVKARKLLSVEIAQALGLQPADADGWIDEQLARPA